MAAIKKVAIRKIPGGPLSTILQYVYETTHHFHTSERWLGVAGAPNETNAADPASFTAFRLDSGNNDWGTAVPIIGSGDTPFIDGHISFDMHRILFVDVERASLYRIRFAWGNSYAEGIALENYTEIVLLRSATGAIAVPPINVRMPILKVGSKVFGNCKNAGATATIDFFIGIHEYTI